MISVADAITIIHSHPARTHSQLVPLAAAVNGYLATTLKADRDLPPFHRVMMDGIAVAHAQYAAGQRSFRVEAIHAAGDPGLSLQDPTACLEVMTGASLPAGTDTVIRYEDVTIANGLAEVHAEAVNVGQSVHQQGADAMQGSTLLTRGTRLTPAEIALLATAGQTHADLIAWPSTAVASTGKEVVPVEVTPLPHQIRSSNREALAAALTEFGIEPYLEHIEDEVEDIKTKLARMLASHDLILLTGGVSKGKFDFVPHVLAELGVQCHFYEVRQRPGKPLWFGTRSDGKTVFALPGNPVSTFLCYYNYVRPWLLHSAGITPPRHEAKLARDFTFDKPLTYFLQVKTTWREGSRWATPLAGGGSGDFVNLKTVDGFLELPAGEDHFAAGQVLHYIPFRSDSV